MYSSIVLHTFTLLYSQSPELHSSCKLKRDTNWTSPISHSSQPQGGYFLKKLRRDPFNPWNLGSYLAISSLFWELPTKGWFKRIQLFQHELYKGINSISISCNGGKIIYRKTFLHVKKTWQKNIAPRKKKTIT